MKLPKYVAELLDYNTIQVLFVVKNTTHFFFLFKFTTHLLFLIVNCHSDPQMTGCCRFFYFSFLFIGFSHTSSTRVAQEGEGGRMDEIFAEEIERNEATKSTHSCTNSSTPSSSTAFKVRTDLSSPVTSSVVSNFPLTVWLDSLSFDFCILVI